MMARAKCKQPAITGKTAREIERRASELVRGGQKFHTALSIASQAVLGCKPRRAIAGEGSLNYFKSIGRFRWE